ncbi:MAG: helix-turn-helix transcriptional regulator [Oscillibacter sp.]|nr:helix-turn-helix transcriptional regulator [Oscillibacter sp.]
MVDCSEKLRKLREARKLTQAQVADRVGVSKTMISAYETASKAPSIEVLIRLSRLDVSGLDDDTVALISALVEKVKSAT